LYALCLSAQSGRKQKPFSFEIEGSVRNYPGQMIYLHHKWDDLSITDSAKVADGHFKFRLKSPEPNMYWLTQTRDVNAQPNTIFFVDRGTLKVLVKGDSIASSSIEGGENQRDYMAYRQLAVDLAVTQQSLQSEYTLAIQRRDVSAAANIQETYQNLGGQHIKNLKSFVKNHPRSAVSGYIIYKELTIPSVPIEEAIECLGYLDKSIEHTKFARLATKKVNDIKGTRVGAVATDFSQATPEGKQVRLSDFRGQFVLVDFWASWCRPCRLENPNVVAAYQQYKDKAFTVLGVSLDSNRDQWIAAIQTDHLTWTNVCDLKGGANEAAVLYGIESIPQNILIDKDGRIIAKNLRGQALEQKLKELIR